MAGLVWVLTFTTVMLCTSATEGAPATQGGPWSMDIMEIALWAARQAALNAQKPATVAPTTPTPTQDLTMQRDASVEGPPTLEGELNNEYLAQLALWVARRARKPDTVVPATPEPIPAPATSGPMKPADMTRNVTVQRDAYVELQCPIKGSPVTWTVVSGQDDAIMTPRLLVFPRMGGAAAQEYRCEVFNNTATLLLSVIDEIPADQKDGDINYCRHGTLCLVPCADKAEWEGVNCTKEQWTPLAWTTAYKVIYTTVCIGFGFCRDE